LVCDDIVDGVGGDLGGVELDGFIGPPLTKVVISNEERGPLTSYPIAGRAGCRARATNGNAAALPTPMYRIRAAPHWTTLPDEAHRRHPGSKNDDKR